jgi:hypothetical protein
VRAASGSWRWLHSRGRRATSPSGVASVSGTVTDVTDRRLAQERVAAELARNEGLVVELQATLQHVKTLKGLLPICMHCHKIRDDEGYWDRLEKYISERTEAVFSHALCPECLEQHYPEYAEAKAPGPGGDGGG